MGTLIVVGIFAAASISPELAQAQTSESKTGELPTDEPPVNFRVTGYGDDWVGMAWEVPRDRGITSYVLQRYEHNGTEYVSSGSAGRFDGDAPGGSGAAFSNGNLDPGTLYKYTLKLRDNLNTTVIESSVTARTLTSSGMNASSTDATLSALTLSSIDIGQFWSGDTYYTATVANSVTQTTVSATVNHLGASYVVKLGGVVDADGVVPLTVGGNTISIVVTAEDETTSEVYSIIVTREGLPVTIEFSPASPVTEGQDVTVTLSFGGLTLDSSANHTYRADVLGSDGSDANVCEGTGMGVNQDMAVVDEDPEVRTVTLSADCGSGTYTIEVTLTSEESVKLAFATASLSVVEVSSEELERRMRDRYDANGDGAISLPEAIKAVQDYFAGLIPLEQAIRVIQLYFLSLG